MKELIKIQQELKAPKGQYNSFGKYKYRSAEDILEAVKPICHKNGCTLTLSDELKQIGDRYYIEATATLTKDDSSISVTAYAREAESKKGMDESQITGTASSYARKYALNGLFCIDDTKDADTDEYTSKTQGGAEEAKQRIMEGETWKKKVLELAHEKGIKAKELAEDYKLNEKTTTEEFKKVYEDLKNE